MNLNIMDPKQIEINKIKNLQYISFYDVTLPMKNGNLTQNVLVPALMVKADGKTFNYSVMDKDFVRFVHKVITVYHKEKDKAPVEGATPSLIPNGIVFDNEYSKKIFEDARFLDENELVGFYYDKDSYDNTLMFEIDEVNNTMDIIRYVIKDFAALTNTTINLSTRWKGYRNRYRNEAEKNGKLTNIVIEYKKQSDNEYHVKILNIGDLGQEYNVIIRFLDNQVYIFGKYGDIEVTTEIIIDDNGARFLYYVYQKRNPIIYNSGDLEITDMPYDNIVNLDSKDEFTWYKLPWNAYIGKSTKISEVDKATSISTNHIMYLDIIGDNFYKREFYNKKLSREKTKTQQRVKITVDEFRKRTIGFKLDEDNFLIETSFKKALGDGEYQDKLINRYFYHVVKAKDIKEIKKDNLKPVTKDLVTDKAHLVDDKKIKRIGERKNGKSV